MDKKEKINSRILKDSNLIVQGNKFINARYKLGLQESRLMYAAMSLISPDDEDFKKYKINVSNLASYLGLVGGNIYTSLKKLTHNLITKTIIIEDEEGWKEFPLLTFAEYEKSDNSITLQFHPEMKPFLIQQRQSFTQAKLQNLIKYGSSYSSRIYLFLRQFMEFKRRDILVEDLKNKLELDNYEYNDLKRRVLLPAQSELEYHSDIRFELIEHRQNKKVFKITFLIYPNDPISSVNEEVSQISAEIINQDEEIEKNFVRLLFKKYDVSKGVGSDLAKTHAKNAPAIFRYIDQQIAKNNSIKNAGGYAVNVIRKGEYEILSDKEEYEEFVQFKKIIFFDSLSKERQQDLISSNNNNFKQALSNITVLECKQDFLLSVLEIKDGDIERRAKAIRKRIEESLSNQKETENSNIMNSLLKAFLEEYGQKIFESLLSDLKISKRTSDEIIFLASSKFARDWIIRDLIEKSDSEKKSLLEVVKSIYPDVNKVAIVANH